MACLRWWPMQRSTRRSSDCRTTAPTGPSSSAKAFVAASSRVLASFSTTVSTATPSSGRVPSTRKDVSHHCVSRRLLITPTTYSSLRRGILINTLPPYDPLSFAPLLLSPRARIRDNGDRDRFEAIF
jgi:hypothetical protein